MTSVATEHYRLLVIEDEVDIRRAVGAALRDQHPAIIEAPTGEAGVEAVDASHPDLIILDLGLPDLDGLAVCERIRAMTASPIIVLTARHGEANTVALLNAGADDYITKPFSTQELAARVAAQLRRARVPPVERDVIVVDGLSIDVHRRQATRDGNLVRLTPIEWELLSVLVSDPGRVFTHQQLFAAGRGAEHDQDVDEGSVRLLEVWPGAAHHQGRQNENPEPQRPIDVLGRPRRFG